MPSFALLDVAIALVFLYLLLSLIASAANEIVSALFQMRARLLEKGVERLLDSEQLKTTLYDHSLLRNLHSFDEPWRLKLRKKNLPSYIPARSFALALMDIIQPGSGTRNALLSPAEVAKLRPAEQDAQPSLLDVLRSAQCVLPAKPKEALVCLIQAAGTDAVRVRESIEHWYNSTMDRVSGAYKRRTQFAIFCIGLVLTIFVNADSVAVAKRLTTSKNLASAIADSASKYVTSSPGLGPGVDAAREFQNSVSTLDGISFPIGWPQSESSQPVRSLIVTHWVGWFLTAFAISFGAPFWFDVLNRFMVVRSTVKPAEKSGQEASKDPTAT